MLPNLLNLTRAITEPEHYDNNIIEKNRYIKSMRKAVFQIMEVSSLMCSLYHLDSYKREYIEIGRYKGESRGGFANLLHHPHGTGDAHA
jgi:hypothetical protein